MFNKQSLHTISQAILAYTNWEQPWEFEKTILQKISNERDLVVFKEIWTTTIASDNWNEPDLSAGFNKTIDVLKRKYHLDIKVCEHLAKAAAYEWK